MFVGNDVIGCDVQLSAEITNQLRVWLKVKLVIFETEAQEVYTAHTHTHTHTHTHGPYTVTFSLQVWCLPPLCSRLLVVSLTFVFVPGALNAPF